MHIHGTEKFNIYNNETERLTFAEKSDTEHKHTKNNLNQKNVPLAVYCLGPMGGSLEKT